YREPLPTGRLDLIAGPAQLSEMLLGQLRQRLGHAHRVTPQPLDIVRRQCQHTATTAAAPDRQTVSTRARSAIRRRHLPFTDGAGAPTGRVRGTFGHIA